LLTAVVAVTGVTAQDAAPAHTGPWSLTDCISYALDHNLTVKSSHLKLLQKEVDLSTAKGRALPGVSASGSENLSFGRGLTADNTYANTNTSSTSFSLGASMTLFEGLTIRNGVLLGKMNLEAATIDLEKARDDIRVQVAQAFVQVLYYQEIEQVAKNQIAIDSMQVVRLTAMRDNGKASQAEVSAQQATLSQSRLTLIQASNNLYLGILDLTQLLELPSPEGFEIMVPETGIEFGQLASPEDIYAIAIGIKPVILSEKVRLSAAEKNIDIANGAYWPSLSLNGGIGSNFYTTFGRESASFGEQMKNNFSQYVTLSLNIPIFNRLSTRNQVRSAKISYDTQALQLENASKSLYKEIQKAYYNTLAAEAKFRGCIDAETSANDAFAQTRAKYENSKATITEFNESKNRLLEAQSNLVQARYEYLYQVKLLDFYAGEELAF